MIKKKEINPNIHDQKDKKKKRKNKKNILTSMTSHVIYKKTDQTAYDDNEEEGPEDGIDGEDDGLGDIEEEDYNNKN